MSKISRSFAAASLLAALSFHPTAATAATGENLDISLCAPGDNAFSLTIDNPYFPLLPGRVSVFSGEEEGESLGLEITVTKGTERFYPGSANFRTRVVQELEWGDANGDGAIDDGEDLIEVSQNYFAQTQDGTVCYFGEVVDIYEDGQVVSHAGTWRADDPGNAPGIFMPATPKKGQHWQIESAPGIAQDEATIVGVRTVTVPAGRFRKALEVADCNPLDGDCGTKFYAPQRGLIADNGLLLLP